MRVIAAVVLLSDAAQKLQVGFGDLSALDIWKWFKK